VYFGSTDGQDGVPMMSVLKEVSPSRILRALMKILRQRSLINR
jgi:hypothetical protein